MIPPKDALLKGVQILERCLDPHGFQFYLRGEGKGSGGPFAWGEFVREDRRLELHFRFTLGHVSYRIGDQGASHEAYMRELGVLAQCNYPGFSQDPLAGFEYLALDLELAEDFLSGSAEVLRRAAIKEVAKNTEDSDRLMATYVGDVQKIEQLRARFREGRFSDVVTIAAELKFPSRLTASEQQMIQLARKKAKAQKT